MQLNIQTQYRYKQFVGYKFAPEQISEFIARKNIQYAYVMLLHIDIENTTDKIVDYDIRKQVESIISQEISHSFKDTSALFFQTNNDRLFCIVPATNFDINSIKVSYQNNITEKRTANDPLVKFENIENKISKEIALKKQLIKPTIQIFISVYGLHDSSIQRCVELCNTLLLSKNNTNLIQIYHPVDYASQNNEMILYKELKNYVNDKNIEIQFKKIILRGETFQLPIYSYPSKNVFEYFKLLQLVPKKLTIILMRHLVALTLQAYSTNSTLSEHNIIIYYPISFIGSTEFIIQNFMNKLKLFSLLPKRVCLMIDLDQTKRLSITTIKNLQALVKNGIRIIYNNINQENINLVNTFDP
jgi:hypothetical protein